MKSYQKAEKRFMIQRAVLKARRNCVVAILLSLAMLLCGCGEAGNVSDGDKAPEKESVESVESGSVGELIVRAETGDEKVIYVAEKADDSLQVPKGHSVRGLTESGTLWGTDGEENLWGRDPFPEWLKIGEAWEIYVSGDDICVLYASQTDKILVMDQQEEQKGSIDFGDATVENIVSGEYAIYRFGEYGARKGVCSLDIQQMKKGETLQTLPEGTKGLLERGSDSENLYLYTAETVYRYSLKEGVFYSVFSWTEAGVTGGSVYMAWKDGDDYYAVVTEGGLPSMTTYRISRKSEDEIPKKKEIVIATLESDTLGVDYRLSNLVVSFNKSQDEYHVTIRGFQEDGSIASREDAYSRLNASLLGSDPPDLLFLANIGYGDELAEHGYLEDLKPFLVSSERIGADDFYPEILSYGTYGDVLYTIPYKFQFETLLVPVSDWDGASGWTYTQMLEYLKGNSEYNPMRHYINMKRYLLWDTIDYFVDEEQGEAHFDSPEFLELLAYMKDCFEKEGSMDPDRRQIMMWDMWTGLSCFETIEGDNGEEYFSIGFPEPDGTMRMILQGDLEFAMVSTARNTEGAWMFLEDFLSSGPEEKDLFWYDQLFSNRNIMQKFIDKELALYGHEYEDIVDEEGNVTRHYANHSITQAHVDNFEKALAAGRKVSFMNTVLGGIVYEETEYYFNGAKSAEEVVKIIQNRANLYLAERR